MKHLRTSNNPWATRLKGTIASISNNPMLAPFIRSILPIPFHGQLAVQTTRIQNSTYNVYNRSQSPIIL